MHDDDENFEGKLWYGTVSYEHRVSREQRRRREYGPEGMVSFVALGCSIEGITELLYTELRARGFDMTGDGDQLLGTPEEAAQALDAELAAKIADLESINPVFFGELPDRWTGR